MANSANSLVYSKSDAKTKDKHPNMALIRCFWNDDHVSRWYKNITMREHPQFQPSTLFSWFLSFSMLLSTENHPQMASNGQNGHQLLEANLIGKNHQPEFKLTIIWWNPPELGMENHQPSGVYIPEEAPAPLLMENLPSLLLSSWVLLVGNYRFPGANFQ